MDDSHRETSAPADSPVAQTVTDTPISQDNTHRKVSFTQSWVLFLGITPNFLVDLPEVPTGFGPFGRL